MKSRTVLVAFFVVCTAVFTQFTFPHTAAAAPGAQWARWFIEVAFANKQPLVQMTIEIGHENRWGSRVVDIVETHLADCQVNGSLEIVDGTGSFDGNTYLFCEMPNFQERVDKLTGGQFEIGENCECKLANGEVDFTFTAPSGNPLFYMPELQFSAPAQVNGTMANYQLFVNGATAESEPFLTNGQMQWGGGAFIQGSAGYSPTFHLELIALGSSPQFIPGILKLPTNETYFFIGFNPDTNEFLQGKLRHLFVDPGCVGHGGI
jgi:hypothetical protein